MRDLIPNPTNPLLQGSTKGADDPASAINCTAPAQVGDLIPRAINCTDGEAVRDLIEHSVSGSTRVAYASDLKHFAEWGGVLPATPEIIAAYVAAYAGTLSVATITTIRLAMHLSGGYLCQHNSIRVVRGRRGGQEV